MKKFIGFYLLATSILSTTASAEILKNVICPKCGYQNHYFYAKKYGTCNLCKTTIDSEYFKRKFMHMNKDLCNSCSSHNESRNNVSAQ